MVKKIISFLLAIALLSSGIMSSGAENDGTQTGQKTASIASGIPTDNLQSEENNNSVAANAQDSITVVSEIENAGEYQIAITYETIEKSADSIEISLSIDGKYPCEEAKSLFLPRFWENSGNLRADDDGNEFAAEVSQTEGCYTVLLCDPAGFLTEPLTFSLEKGKHNITVTGVSQRFSLKKIEFKKPVETPKYKAYIKSFENTDDFDGKSICIEGEAAKVRSKKSIVPLSDNSSAAIMPQNAFKSRINYIGSKNWNRPGDIITWEIDVPETGLYSLNFNYRQNTTLNEIFYRTLEIDGEVPFEEAKTVDFPYTGGWSDRTFADKNSEPYKLYLEKGKHTLSLSVTMGPLSKVCGKLNDLVFDMSVFYRNMVMITGENPDANRDYNLFSQMENYDQRIEQFVKQLDELIKMLYDITGNSSGTAPANLRNMKDVLCRMRDNKYYAHQYKDRFYSNYAALSAWVYERSSMAMDIDAFFLTSPERPDDGRNTGRLAKMAFSAKRFISSFISDYKDNTENNTNESITLWINWGRDQAKVLKNLVSSNFSPKSGIHVNIRVTNATLLQGILSGNGPDCSLQVSRSEPVNLAMRGGLYDLSEFNDYNQVMKRFMPGADVPYTYNGGHYGLPNTQSFYMLFYRTDIFEQMGLTVPDTWDDFLNISNLMLRKNMQVGLPYIQITDMTQVNAGVGALNIFPTLLLQNGLSIYNDSLTASTLNDSKTVSVFVQWTNYYNKYGFPKSYDFYNRFRVGLMPMAVASFGMYATLTAAAPEINRFWKMAQLPGVRQKDGSVNRAAAGGGSAAVILKESKKHELAWEFIKWWTDADTQYSYASEVENILGTSARHDTANVEALSRLSWDKESLDALMNQWKNVKEIPEIPGGYYLSRVIDQAFWNTTNGEDPYEMTEEWGKIANSEIERKSKQYGQKRF